MFESSFLLGLWALCVNLFVPCITGALTLWLLFGKKYTGILFYSLCFLIGTGVVAYSMFNMQFIHMGIGLAEYLCINLVLLLGLGWKMFTKKISIPDILSTLSIKNEISDITHSFHKIPRIQKIYSVLGIGVVLIFLSLSFLFSFHFPSYADDTFTNWNRPSLNIYHDDGIKMFGSSEEILGRARLGYPLYIPIYTALISDIFGSWNDIYISLWQYLSLFFLLCMVTSFTWTRTKNIFFTVLPSVCITGLPLIFFHSVESYLDLACAIYSIGMIYFLFLFLEEKKKSHLVLAFLFGGILSQIKNDGLIIYFLGILVAFLIFFLSTTDWKEVKKLVSEDTKILWILGAILAWFVLPFIILKKFYDLGYNQAAGNIDGIGVSSTIHWEIFSVFPSLFFRADNYNLALLLIIPLIFWGLKKKMHALRFVIFAGLSIFLLFIAVFLFTENYKWVLDQTTVNRVFTMVFVILFSFIGCISHAYHK